MMFPYACTYFANPFLESECLFWWVVPSLTTNMVWISKSYILKAIIVVINNNNNSNNDSDVENSPLQNKWTFVKINSPENIITSSTQRLELIIK